MNRFQDKVALITGASSGLGAATAVLLANEGATIFGLGRNGERLEQTHADIEQAGGSMTSWFCDIRDVEQCQAAVDACIDAYGRLDVLVNCAGSHRFRISATIEPDEWQEDLAINLSGSFYMCQAAIPHLLESEGNIVNVGSLASTEGQAYSAGYCAAKHGLIGLTRSLALEYIKSPLRINAVCPGGMDTPQVQNISFPADVDFELVMRSAGSRGMMPAEDVADVIAFMASDQARAIHGAVTMADAGKQTG